MAIPTCDEFCGEDALTYGVLASDGEGCVWISDDDQPGATSVVWPHGFSARMSDTGLELLGPDGEVPPCSRPSPQASAQLFRHGLGDLSAKTPWSG